jgi:TonB family protein
MMAAWMVYATVVAALLGCAALAAERALRLVGRQARWVWAGALAASLTVPLLAGRPGPPAPAVDAGVVQVVARAVTAAVPEPTAGLTALDAPLRVGWALASGLVLVMLVLAQRALRREAAGGVERDLDGHRVRVTPTAGPAVVGGLRRATIVLPAWITDLDPETRRLAVRHEAEHVETGDVRLLGLAALAVAICPWNPALWWQVRALRDAVELDCDHRLVRAGVDVRAYGSLLLEVARRASLTRMAAALAARPTLLSRRIDHMTPTHSATRGPRAVAAAVVGVLLVVLACEAPTPAAETAATAPTVRLQDGPPVLESLPEPVYPPLVRQAGIEGDVVLEFLVDATGRVDTSAAIGVVSGMDTPHRALVVSAMSAIRGARFRPAVVNGEPAALRIRQTVSFRLPAD